MNFENLPNSSSTGIAASTGNYDSLLNSKSESALSSELAELTIHTPATELSKDSVLSVTSSSDIPDLLRPQYDTQILLELNCTGRSCYDCHRFLSLEAFAKAVINGAEYRTKRCNRCRVKRQQGSPKTKRRKEWLREVKSHPCTDCKQTFPPECMDLDHVRGDKKHNIAAAYLWLNQEELEVEYSKCELVCANCHRTRSIGRKQSRGRPPKYS